MYSRCFCGTSVASTCARVSLRLRSPVLLMVGSYLVRFRVRVRVRVRVRARARAREG